MIPVTMPQLVEMIESRAAGQARTIVAIAGPPASGKSTVSETLAESVQPSAMVVPMDGFHMDNAALSRQGLLAQKGAPETFDASGFVALVQRLKQDPEVAFPTFDRVADKTVPDGGHVGKDTRIILVEGNYLLLDQAPWRALSAVFDLTVSLDVPRDALQARLIARWRDHGLSPQDATARAIGNDMKNVDFVKAHARAADFVLQT